MTTQADHDKRCPAAWDTSVKCNCGAAAADELCRLHTNNLAEPQLNWLQEEVASCYSDGEFAHTKSLDAAQNVGDGLFTFCINEAGDAGDKPELINMLNRAINQLSALVDALETAP